MHRCIYQYFVGRHHTASITRHPGSVLMRMSNFNWQKLTEAGFTHLYLLGLFDSRGPIVVTHEDGVRLDADAQDRLPSVFAVTDQTKIHPILGTTADFKKLLNTIHSRNLKVVVDFIPNHTSSTHRWLTEHPDWYQYTEGGDLRRAFSDDVCVLNYDSAELRAAQIEVMKQILELGVDGLRVDMAHLIPVFFWQEAIKEVRKAIPFAELIAEAYSPSVFDWQGLRELLSAGFDGVYHEFLYRHLKQSPPDWQGLAQHVNYVIGQPDLADSLVAYASNHDDQVPGSVQAYLPGLMGLLLFISPQTLWFNGVFLGKMKRLAHHRYEELEHSKDELGSGFGQYQHLLEWVKNHDLRVDRLVFEQPGWIKASLFDGVYRQTYQAWLNTAPRNVNVPFLSTSIELRLGCARGDHVPPGSLILVKA